MSRSASARLFVAIDPPPAVGEELAAWARRVATGMRARGGTRGSLRLLDAHSLHLTLCFLGSRPVDEIEPLSGAVAACQERSFELSVGAPLWLPPRRPRALAVEIHDRSGRLADLQERLTAALCGACAWQPERRRFRPHITLARVHGQLRRPSRARQPHERGEEPDDTREPALPPTPRLGFTAEAIVLYRSWLAPEGASYQELISNALSPD